MEAVVSTSEEKKAPTYMERLQKEHCSFDLMNFFRVSKGVGGWWFQILVTTSYLTQIDTRQKDLQLSAP